MLFFGFTIFVVLTRYVIVSAPTVAHTRLSPDPHVNVVVSSCLHSVSRSLMYAHVGRRIFEPNRDYSRKTILVAAILLLGGIEPNPGPADSRSAYSTIRIGSLNVRSAVHKAPLIHDVIRDRSLDVLVTIETWFKADMPPAITDSIAPSGFRVKHFMRDGRGGGGISVIYGSNLHVSNISNISSFTTFESLGLKIISGTSVWNVLSVYRPPPAPNREFFDDLLDCIGELQTLPGCLVLCGDFNCPGNSSESIDVRLQELFDQSIMTVCSSGPTRVTADGSEGNLLDLIVHNANDNVVNDFGTVDTGIADHLLVAASFNFPSIKVKATTFTGRNLKKLDYDKLWNELSSCSFVQSPSHDVDIFVQQLNDDVTSVLDRLAPIPKKNEAVK